MTGTGASVAWDIADSDLGPVGAARAALVACVLLGLASATFAPITAQMQPVYPVYEGWTTNPDGSYTLVFGYHNENSVPVEIAPGSENGFVPGPNDRGQPARFLPGRQRNVCRIVLDAGFAGNLQWTLGVAGKRQSTTENGGLDSRYPLEEIGSGYRAAREIDPTRAPRGRCVNRAPTVSAGRGVETEMSTAVELSGFVVDDGLPREGTLAVAWRQLDGPSEVTFALPSSPRTRATFSAAGTYVLELSASDSELESRSTVTVTVKPPASPRPAAAPRR